MGTITIKMYCQISIPFVFEIRAADTTLRSIFVTYLFSQQSEEDLGINDEMRRQLIF